MTVLRPVSRSQSALAASRCWQAFARVTSSGPCHSSPLARCPLGVSVPSLGLRRALAAQAHCPKPALLPTRLGNTGWPMQECTDRAKKPPELFAFCMQMAPERHQKPNTTSRTPSPVYFSPQEVIAVWEGDEAPAFAHFLLPVWSCLCATSQQILSFYNF